MRTEILASACVALFALAVCTVARGGDLDRFLGTKGEIRIAGGTAHIPVMKEAARRIMTANSYIRISIAGGGSGVGIKQVGEGLVDIGNSGRKPTDSEISRYGLYPVRWAVDGVGVIVHPGNEVQALTRTQLQGIFAGTLSNWSEVGGADGRINLYTRDESSGTREVFWKKALAKGEISRKANFVVSNGAMKSAVSQDPYGIGYVSVGHIDDSVAPVALDGVVPTREAVRDGRYPIARGLYSNTKGEPSGLTKLFIEYLLSPEGQRIAAEKGFVPAR